MNVGKKKVVRLQLGRYHLKIKLNGEDLEEEKEFK